MKMPNDLSDYRLWELPKDSFFSFSYLKTFIEERRKRGKNGKENIKQLTVKKEKKSKT